MVLLAAANKLFNFIFKKGWYKLKSNAECEVLTAVGEYLTSEMSDDLQRTSKHYNP
jgi:hypothetical protein